MTTHLRARAVQAGALLALVGGTIAVAASPAQAAPPTVTIDSVSSSNVKAGDRITLRYTVNSLPAPSSREQVRISIEGMDCTGDCSPRLSPGQRQSFTANLTAGGVDAGDVKTVRVEVVAEFEDESGTASQDITVRGPDKPKQVRRIAGRVKDSDGKAVSGAQVLMKDSAGHQYDTTSDGDGGYEFGSSDDRPIVPGTISIGAAKDGYEPAAVNVRAAADKTVTVALTLVSNSAPSPSAKPSATEKPSAEPLDDATDEADQATEAPPADPQNAANNTDDDGGSMLFIILGGLLVAAGIGAIVLVLMRRKDNGDDDADAVKPAGVIPPGQGRFADDATRVAAPVGGRANDATMVAGMPAATSLSDAPTMLQRAVPADDEFPDPYGAPAGAPQAGAYGAPAYGGGYDDGGYSAPQPTGTYGAAATGTYGGAAPQQRYDEPTGMYRPDDQGYGGYPQADPEYPQPTGYQPQQAPADQGGYGGWNDGYPEQQPQQPQHQQYGGGYGYGAPAGGGTYGAPAGGNYDGGGYDNGGYAGDYDERATYGRPDNYDQAPPQQQGGGTYGGGQPGTYGGTYGAPPNGGYDQGGAYGGGDQGGGRHGGQPGQRRSLDWMDD